MTKPKALALSVSVMLLVVASMTFLAAATTVAPFTLSSSSGQLSYILPQGTIFNGTVSATGPIRVWMNGPSGAQIVNLGLVDTSTSFGFVAQKAGNYTLNFENNLPSSVEVSFSYVTDPDLSSANSTPTALTYLALIAITVAGIIIIFLVVRIRKRSQKQKTLEKDDSAAA